METLNRIKIPRIAKRTWGRQISNQAAVLKATT